MMILAMMIPAVHEIAARTIVDDTNATCILVGEELTSDGVVLAAAPDQSKPAASIWTEN